VGLSQALGETLRVASRFDPAALQRTKKELIEKQCFGLVDFVEPRFDLGMVVAPPAVKNRLLADAALIREGRHAALPMGYLVCGVLGTGKTFTATCFAGSIGIPALVFRNLREKWVGSSEGNMQKVLAVVRALGPVVVIVDEADAALGDRGADGDSGTSGRMFAMISSQMSDTTYRGRIIWMLLTCRPDLLPVDLKRQGRCEVHIPLFVPQSDEERRTMFLAMARKNKVAVEPADVPVIPAELSGADIESLVVQCVREAAIAGREAPSREMIAATVSRFVSPNYSLQKELQELVAVREATDLGFLPERYQAVLRDPDRAAAMERRIQELTLLLGDR
jgi:SpoVK/Ycf46/Vps4 family AAA+-type ATPase